MTTNKEKTWLLQDKYGGTECEAFYKDLERLEAGEPLAYVIGWVPFLNTKIWLDSKPLIPRPETEYWVEKAIAGVKEKGKPVKVLDLCAGSGAIGVAILKAVPEAFVDFAEMDESHHHTIRKNLAEAGISQDRFNIFGGDLFENIHESYDLILTNPPYIDHELKRVGESVLGHEPHLALFGGEKGVEIIHRILEEASDHLNSGGVIYLEHEPEQESAIAQHPTYRESRKDQFGVTRFSIFKKDP